MTETEIFQYLLAETKKSKDPRGAAAACIARSGELLLSATSSDDGKYHAEHRLIEAIQADELTLEAPDILYTTVEPCSSRADETHPSDDVSLLIELGIREIVFALRSPSYAGTLSLARLQDAGIAMRQLDNPTLVQDIAEHFNTSLDPTEPGVDKKPTN